MSELHGYADKPYLASSLKFKLYGIVIMGRLYYGFWTYV